jgi:glycosyltransferase involved in cell wall biosynthesis
VWYRGTGIGAYTRDLLANLQLVSGDEQYLILWPDDGPVPRLPSGWRPVPVPRRRERERETLAAWLARESVDVYHVPQNGLRAPGTLPPGRLVITLHDLIPFLVPETVRHSYSRRFLREVPQAVLRAAAIIAVSQHTANDARRLLGARREQLRVVPAAPDPGLAPVPRDEARQAVAARHGLRHPYILYVGGLNPRKSVPDLIYAYSRVCRALWPQLDLVIAGDSSRHAGPLRAMAEALGIGPYVGWPGHIADPDLPALYSAAEFLVYPSLYEGFGLPPLEAMACGLPVVCSDAASLPEATGGAAVVFPAGDVTALAHAIAGVAADPALRRRLSEQGRQRAARFTWLDAARQIRQVYLETAAQEDPRQG